MDQSLILSWKMFQSIGNVYFIMLIYFRALSFKVKFCILKLFKNPGKNLKFRLSVEIHFLFFLHKWLHFIKLTFL